MTIQELTTEWKSRNDVSATEIIDRLREVGCEFTVNDGRLYFPLGFTLPDLIETVTAHEPDIIAILAPGETARVTTEANMPIADLNTGKPKSMPPEPQPTKGTPPDASQQQP